MITLSAIIVIMLVLFGLVLGVVLVGIIFAWMIDKGAEEIRSADRYWE